MKYQYFGPVSGITLEPPDGPPREIMLNPRATVDLPDDHPRVKRLVAQKLLVPVSEAQEVVDGG